MRCLSCNEPLKPYDRVRKSLSGFYVDLCFHCYQSVKDELPTYGNPTMYHEEDEEVTLFDDSASPVWGIDRAEKTGYNNYIDEEDN